MDEGDEDQILGTSALRGILLLGGVVTAAFFAWKYWKKIRAADADVPAIQRIVRVPVSLPLVPDKKRS